MWHPCASFTEIVLASTTRWAWRSTAKMAKSGSRTTATTQLWRSTAELKVILRRNVRCEAHRWALQPLDSAIPWRWHTIPSAEKFWYPIESASRVWRHLPGWQTETWRRRELLPDKDPSLADQFTAWLTTRCLMKSWFPMHWLTRF